MKKPELLAPAGNYASLLAAVSAGASAVYFGGKNYSARNFAQNFSNEEIVNAIDYAHLRGVKCYVAVNTLVKDLEIRDVFDYINFLYEKGADALIIQDLGVLNLCKKYFSDLPLHASTQMTAHSLNDAMKLKEMGFKRVVLSRELTLSEINDIKEKAGIEIECFVHGALCFSYSGRCFFSSSLGARSGNRGRCAQPCRKKYILFDRLNNKNLEEMGYLLSTKDLCMLEITNQLKFIDSLKIEGRMKSAEYVGGVVSKYRKYIDASEAAGEDQISTDKTELAAIFNRGGFCEGYYLDKKPSDLIAKERSKNYGVLVGKVIEKRNNMVKIEVHDVKVNDGLEIWGRSGQEENAGFRVPKINNGMIEIRLSGDVEVGDPVYKTHDYDLNLSLSKFAKEIYPENIPVNIYFEAKSGKEMRLVANNVEVRGGVPQKAEKFETTENAMKQQLGKLGGTPFFARSIQINADEGINIPIKEINRMRRQAVEKLMEKAILSFRRKAKTFNARHENDEAVQNQKKIFIETDDMKILKELETRKIHRIYTSRKIDIEKYRKLGIEVFQKLPVILRDGERLNVFSEYDGYLVSCLGNLEMLPEKKPKIADYFFNVFNSRAVNEAKDLGFSGFTTSVENTLEEINAIKNGSLQKEVIIYGRWSIMTSEHCVLRGTAYCKNKNVGLKDEEKAVYPLFTDCVNCRMQILSEKTMEIRRIHDLNCDAIRLAHTVETPNKFLKKLDEYIAGKFSGKKKTWPGHFTEGIE